MKRVSILATLVVLAMFMLFTANSFAAGEKMDEKSSAPASQSATGRETGQQMATTESRADKSLMISEILGKDLLGERGEKLGEVKDLLISSEGEITFALVSRGGVLGVGEQYAPVPWSAVSRSGEKGQFATNISKERFDKAPTLSKDEISNLAQSEIEHKVHGYYGGTMPEGGTKPMK
jgi:sporulation protein YlmC with PRC-barrel domain